MRFDLARFLSKVTTVHETHGNEYVVPCTCDAGKDTAHLWVNVHKGKAICYRCGKKLGDVVGVIGAVAGLDMVAASQVVNEQGSEPGAGWQSLHEALTPQVSTTQTQDTPEVRLPQEFLPILAQENLPDYAVGRGITLAMAIEYGMGVCMSGYYDRRLIIPVHDAQGVLRSFVARLMVPSKRTCKVLYPKGSKTGFLLFSEKRARRGDTVVITEGVFDAIRVGPRAVALFGKHASAVQLSRLVALGESRRLVVMLDDDAQQNAEALATDLARHGCEVALAKMPSWRHDPGECMPDEIEQAIEGATPCGTRRGRLASLLAVGTRDSP